MASVLSSFFSRDPRSAFSYDIPTDSFTCYRGILMGNSFKKNEPNEKATCFWSNTYSTPLKTQAQKLKTLRHPNILVYFDYLEVDNGMYLITEPCQPLEHYFSHTKLTDAQKELFVSWGLYQILNCLKFLHNEVKISQNNMKEAIYITAAGDWKLSGFQSTSAFSSPQVDLNDLAAVVWQIFSGFSTASSADASSRSIARIPKRLHALYKKMDSRSKAFPAANLLTECRSTGGFMNNKFVDTLLFLEEFQLKDSGEKQTFFVHLKDTLDMFPEDVAKRKILPKLIHAYEYGDAGSHILVPMFKLGRLLDEEEYQYRIVPCLVKLFSSSDRTTRVKLLEKIDDFAPHLRPEVVNDSIYANLVTGFTDTNPAVRESTVKAMVSIAEKLNYHNLNSDLMKYLARLQGGDEQPGIRTNTTICLGKIGCYIDASHRQRILISAFTRALKDPFPPARMAGVLALSATQQYYSLVEVATKVMPSLAPLTMDPEKQVRDQGFKALKGFLEKLEKASENPEIIPELEAQVKAGGRSGLLSSEKVPQWAGWALKALSGKFYKTTPAASAPTTIAAENGFGAKSTSGVSAPTSEPKDIIAKKPEKVQKIVDDGWGDFEDDVGDFEECESSKISASQRKPSNASFTSAASSRLAGGSSAALADMWSAPMADAPSTKFNELSNANLFGVLGGDSDEIGGGWGGDDSTGIIVDFSSSSSPPMCGSSPSLLTKKGTAAVSPDSAADAFDDWAPFSSSTYSAATTSKPEKVAGKQPPATATVVASTTAPAASSKGATARKATLKGSGALKLGSGPMKLGAKKVAAKTLPDDLERDLFE